MALKIYKFNLIFLSFIAQGQAQWNIDVDIRNPAIDYKFHEDVLDTEKCQEQISVLRSNPLLYFQCK